MPSTNPPSPPNPQQQQPPPPPPKTYTIAPHLSQYALPLNTFAAHQPADTFVVGAFIFSPNPSPQGPIPTTTSTAPKDPNPNPNPKASPLNTKTSPLNPNKNGPKTLLLQRSPHDSYPYHWEGPGGGIEPAQDATLLDGAAREVFEETGLRVVRFVDVVAVDRWKDKLHVISYDM
ncbi:hypothetical protein BO71DRAFT_482697 [Aspergillus ellipticus CBS 707.79]|uniref:Nudix hydrolase domain-containing protein n=1 Tax=Aspergillus ellipticus CBS 707.79 TaxID=1448320 RepID=A0A319DEP2_9EURO|nr:hypothetical protein BO71DRAFT_482697 [Aspergillus ellipticus CBS 707.79]